MDPSPVVDEVLAAARRHAAAGAWSEVRKLLSSTSDGLTSPEVALLRAESELRTGRPREARDWLGKAIPAIERVGDRGALRKALNQLGVAEIELGALDDAERTFGRAVELARVDRDDLVVAHATNNMGAIANIRGRRDEALTLYQLAIPAYQRMGHTIGLAQTLHNMAISYRHLGHLARADEYEQRAIGYATEAANAPLLALARLERAELSLESGDAALAEVGAQRASREFAALPDAIREADALRVVGAARLALTKYVGAEEVLARALSLAHEHGSALVEAETLRVRAAVAMARGESADARAYIDVAIGTFERLGAAAQRDEALAWSLRVLAPRHT